MKSLSCLVLATLENAGLLCGVDVRRDLQEVAVRSKCEGESFLTHVLPSFATAFEQSLAAESVASVAFPGFRKRGGYPLFLGGMLRLIFSDDGTSVRVDASIDAVRAIRQVCGVVGKIFEVCPPKFEQSSYDGFHTCEQELKGLWFDPRSLSELASAAARYFGPELSAIENKCASAHLVPRHGPGGTSDGLRGNAKFDNVLWSTRLEKVADPGEYLVPYRGEAFLDRVQLLEPRDEPPLKVVAVPKTSRKARIIAIEPTYRQWAQQALLKEFSAVLTGTTVDLSDQNHNRVLARAGSIDGAWATLDMSEASDRVHLAVVNAVFNRFPHTRRFLMASRGTTARTPDGRVSRLRKFASMGSAVCFPVESVVFATMAMLAIEQAANASSCAAKPTVAELRRTVRVFGDDIIVPTRHAHDVISLLVRLGCRPNPNKSFWSGNFRESCGGDYFRGNDVTIARLRRRLPESHRDAQEILSLVAFRNHMYDRGYWTVASRIDERLAQLRVPMPIVEETSPIAGRRSVFQFRAQRFHPDYQSPLVRGLMVRSRPPLSRASAWGALMKCTGPDRREPYADPEHLDRSGRPDRVHTKVGWGQPY